MPDAFYLRQEDTNYKFIKPLLDSEYNSAEEGTKFYPYEASLETEVARRINQDPDMRTSMYYNDLTNLSWVGVNENDTYNLASLIKLPLLIAYYKLSEREPGLFAQKIRLSGPDLNTEKNIQSPNFAAIGQIYTVKDLLDKAIVSSDNNAAAALYVFRGDAVKNVFADLNAPFPQSVQDLSDTDYFSAKNYVIFLKVLYDASYLSRDDSDETLDLLTKTEFNDGLVAGLPAGVVAAHKFGERSLHDQNGQLVSQEFHDCGIVYNPSRPYELCVMTEGKDLAGQEKMVKDISAIVYQEATR